MVPDRVDLQLNDELGWACAAVTARHQTSIRSCLRAILLDICCFRPQFVHIASVSARGSFILHWCDAMRRFLGVMAFVLLTTHSAAAKTIGSASWYALTSRTASGEMCNPAAMTAAHRTLPFGTRVKVTNLSNGKSAVVRINDRGPFAKGRIIDVTRAAAQKLGFIQKGHTRVSIERVSKSATLGAQPVWPRLGQLRTLPKPHFRHAIERNSL